MFPGIRHVFGPSPLEQSFIQDVVAYHLDDTVSEVQPKN
jgi:hypothetical protein